MSGYLCSATSFEAPEGDAARIPRSRAFQRPKVLALLLEIRVLDRRPDLDRAMRKRSSARERVRRWGTLRDAALQEKPAKASPAYATGGLELALRDAVESFLRPWEA